MTHGMTSTGHEGDEVDDADGGEGERGGDEGGGDEDGPKTFGNNFMRQE